MKINVIFIAAALVLSAACNGGNQQNEKFYQRNYRKEL